MTHGATHWLLLIAARQDSFRVWGRFDHGRAAFGLTEMLIVGAAAFLVVALLVWNRLTRRHQKDFWCNNPARLFQELCRAHRLERADRRLLKRLAAARGVETPALLFVEPEHFDTTSLPPNLKSSASDVRKLRDELFR